MSNPKVKSQNQIIVGPDSDAFHFLDTRGNVIGWIDGTGTLQGNLAVNTSITTGNIQGNPISPIPPGPDQVLAWNGSAWAPAPLPPPITNSTFLQGNPISQTIPHINQALIWNGTSWSPGTVSGGTSGNYGILVTDNGVVCDGITDDTAAMNALITTIASAPVKLIFPSGGKCLLGTISFPRNIILDFSLGGALKVVTGQTISIHGQIFTAGPVSDLSQIFYNANAGQGTIDLGSVGGGYVITDVYPEWWGASPAATAAINTPAFQAAINGAYGAGRTNASGLYKYNRVLHLSGMYDINNELKCYDMIGFRWKGESQLNSGLRQNATNKRIIDGQSVAYGRFEHLRWEAAASQNVPLVDLDYNGTTTSGDLRPQFIDFQSNFFVGNGLGQIGVLIAKSGGGAQGSNIVFWNCAGLSFTEACVQCGGNNSGINVGRFYAQNALAISWYQGDIQGCPHYGIVTYGAGFVEVRDSTFENGFATQTGFDMYCEAPQGPLVIDNVRSESRKFAASGSLRIRNSGTGSGQAALWYAANSNLPGSTSFTNQLIWGTAIGSDGAYYAVQNSGGIFGGLTLTNATGGTATTITVAGTPWTTNQFQGQQVTLYSGTGKGQFGVITSNDSSTLTLSAGWITNYTSLLIVNPDATTQFVIEPNWTSNPTSSGTVNFTKMVFSVIEGDLGGPSNDCWLENVTAPGGFVKLNANATSNTYVQRLVVSRPDWFNAGAFQLGDSILTSTFENIIINRGDNSNIAGSKFKWNFTRNGPATSYSNYSQKNFGTVPVVWSASQTGGGLAAPDVWIGGRSDPGSTSSISRAILETGGMLGRPTPFGTDKNGSKMQIQGGLPTGAGTPGPIEFWMGKAGNSGTSITDGSAVAGIRENGLSWTLFGSAVASASTITPTGNLFHVTGTTGITSISGIGINSGSEITIIFDGQLIVTNGSNLRLSGDFSTSVNSTLTLVWDGSNWYEKGRKA